MSEQALRRGILVVDIEGFGRLARTDAVRAHLRERLYTLVDDALAAAEIPAQELELRGDGLLVLLDPHVSVAGLLHPFLPHLARELASHNEGSTDTTRLRLRMVIHEGQVLPDAHGYTGAALVHAFRLVDSEIVRRVLRSVPVADLVLVVSSSVWQDIVSQEYAGIDRADFQPVWIHAKETRARAWVHVVGQHEQPQITAILTASPDGPATRPIPKQLPPAVAHFTGRHAELARLRALAQEGDTGMVVISAISGMAGVGKTVLALHLAHELAASFPNAQLYVNLQGYDTDQRLSPSQVLDRFLRALGVPSEGLPTDVDQQAALYRSLLADTRTLVVLDNASSADQVRPLLPGSPTCLVLVTSRDRLAGLVVKEGARLLALDVLSPEEAIDLLGRIAGADRVAAQRDEAARIVRLCGYLPLAVRVAATQLAIRPNQSLRTLSDRLADEKSRLQHLQVGDVEVRSTLTIGYSRLLADERRAFRLLGTLRFADIPAWVVATLAECDLTTAEQLAERLIDVGLLDSADEDAAGQFRYRLHDLLRLLARERTEQEDSASQRNAAVESVLAAHLSAAKLAVLQLQNRASPTQPPGSDGMSSLERLGVRRSIAADAAVWLRVELENLTLAVEQACDAGQWAIACELAVTLTDYYDTQSLWEQWERSHTRALTAARRMGDRALEADILWRLGRRYRYGRPDDALGAYDACIRLYRELGDRQGEGCALLEVGVVHREQGRLAEARSAYADCLATFVELGDRRREAYTLRRLAFVETDQASIVDAIAHFQQCLAILEEFDDVPWMARTLRGLSIAYRLLGYYAEAEDSARRALEAFRATSDERGAGYALLDLGGIRAEQGRHDEASELLSDCLTRFRAASDGRGEAYALLDLSSVQACQGQFELAVSNAKRARSFCTAIRDERGLAWADLCMADLLREQDDLAGAASIYSLCFPVFRELGDQVGMAHSLLRRGIVELRRGDVEAAHSSWRGAKPLFAAAHMPESGELGDWLVRSPSEESMRGRIGRLRCMVDPGQENP